MNRNVPSQPATPTINVYYAFYLLVMSLYDGVQHIGLCPDEGQKSLPASVAVTTHIAEFVRRGH